MVQTGIKASKKIVKEINANWYVVFLIVVFVFFALYPFFRNDGARILLKAKRMFNRQAHVVIISTYGPSVNGSPFYEEYVDKAVNFILDPKNEVDEIIIVGGYTVDPSRSQSQGVLDFMKEKYPALIQKNFPVTLDECGITTWQNIINSKKLMDKEGITPKKITIFAEESREKKIAFFANNVFHWDASVIMDKRKILMEVDPLISTSKETQLFALTHSEKYEWPRFTYIKDTYLIDKNIRIITMPSGLPQNFVDDEHIKIFQEIKEFYDSNYGSQAIKERLDSWEKTAGFNTVQNLVDKGCAEYKQFLDK